MTTAPRTPAPTDVGTSEIQDLLNDFVRLGHRLGQLMLAQAEAGTLPAVEASQAYDRVGRRICRCALTARKLAQPAKTIDRTAVRKRVLRAVEDTIQRHTEDEDEAETLHAELLDRLDTLDLEDEIGTRPVEDIITDIIRDLGLAAVPGNHPWKRRTPEDVALLCARAKQPIPAPNRATAAAPPLQSQTRRQPVACNSS